MASQRWFSFDRLVTCELRLVVHNRSACVIAGDGRWRAAARSNAAGSVNGPARRRLIDVGALARKDDSGRR